MKSLFNTGLVFPWIRNFSLLLAGAAVLTALFAPLRAQDVSALGTPDASQLAGIKAAQKPKSDKWAFSFLPVGLQKNPQVDYAIVTEMTDEGRKLPEPSFDHPVYYISHSMGQRDVGDAYGGTKPIPYAFLQKALNNSLASNGYRPSNPEHPEQVDPAHPPTQVLFFAWGMHNKIEQIDPSTDDGSNTSDDGTGDGSGDGSGDSAGSSFAGSTSLAADTSGIANLLSRAKIVGGQKFANEYAQALMEGGNAMRIFSQRDDLTETLCYEVQNECYYLLVTAMDAEALARKERKVLWTTKISTIEQGVSFEATLPIMINNASYFFGRETNGAEIVRKRAYKNASVSIGEATVVEYISGSTFSSGTGAVSKPATTPAPATSGTTGR